MAVKVRRGKKWRPLVLDQRLLVGLGRYPEHDHVRIALPGLWVNCVWPGSAEEDKRFAANLIDGVAAWPMFDRDIGHR